MIRNIAIAIISFFCATNVLAQDISSIAEQELKPYSYVMVVTEPEQLAIDDEKFYHISNKVVFPVNRSELPESSPFLKELAEKVIPVINRDSLQLEYLMVRGAASPEGSYENNKRLGEARAKSLFDYLNSHLRFPAREGRYTQNNVPEDYVGLCRLMREANDNDYSVVKDICDLCLADNNVTKLKERLQTVDNGRLWSRLLKEYFPQLRAARLVLFFRKYSAHDRFFLPKCERYAKIEYPQSVVTQRNLSPVFLGYIKAMPEPEPLDSILVRRHVLAIKTNLLYDFFYMPGHYWAPSPNLQLEYYPKSGHMTLNLGLTFPYWHWWSKYQFWQIRDYNIEGRYYFKGHGEFYGPYVAADIRNTIYGIGFGKDKGWEGEGLGGGLSFGWVWHLSKNKRWRLEANIGVGYFRTTYDPYVYGNPVSGEEDGKYYYDYTGAVSKFKERNHVFQWIGPTQVGLHLTYDILYRRINKRGVSVNRTERVNITGAQKGGRR